MGDNFCVVGPTKGFEHTHTIVFLHGKGSDCNEFASELFESEASRHIAPKGSTTLQALFPSIRWVFPSAPKMRSERFNCIDSQWFDIWAVENPDEMFESQIEGLQQSILLLESVITNEEKRAPREKIFLASMSQGFATVMTMALLSGGTFAGLIGLCTWMPKGAYNAIKAAAASDNVLTNTPIFLGHAKHDNVVPVGNGQAIRDYLSQNHNDLVVEWHEYASEEHWIVEPEGVDDMVTFLRANMT